MFGKPFLTRIRRKVPAIKQVFRRPKVSDFKINKWRKKLTWRFLLRVAIVCAGVFIIFAIVLFAWYAKDLPRPGELRSYSTSESTILYDRNGKQIYDISGEQRRIILKSDQIPDISKKATVAIEDKNFYKHHGVDFKGLFRGVIIRPLTGKKPQGGSTITQQYVKNALLSPKRSVVRKVKELILSLEIETIYSKDDVLTLYLNEIPFGANIYGIEAASQAFFGKSAKDLTLPQAATLAALPNYPTRYSPWGSHVDELIKRKNRVLDDMVKTGAIAQEEADKAKQEAPLVAKDFTQPRNNFPAPHFVMYVREQLAQKYGEDLVERGGLRVTTSLDLDLQAKADEAVKEQGAKVLSKAKASNASLVAIDPKTGQLLAMVGSLDYFDREHEGNFNVATGFRQPGSAGKPIVYATLMEDKWSPSSAMWDVQTDFNGYKPNNFDGKFHGPVSIRNALGNSLNIPAVKALQLTGINNFLKTAKDMGITTLDDRQDAGLSLALGGGEVKLIDLTAAYSVFANNGERHPLATILKIQDSRGKTLDEWKPNSKQVIKSEIAYEISHILADTNAKRPTFSRLLNVLSISGKTVAVKTGTTNGFKDAWTIGYTPSLAAGVWAGNNDGSEMDHGGGSTVAAPIWHAFMIKALNGKKDEPFTRPPTVTDRTVDFLSGKNPTPASGQLVQDLFAPWQVPTKDDDVHKIVKVCRSNGKLATDVTPPDEIEERTYTQVHSERPEFPNWEGPVQAWARGAGLVGDSPPTEKCDLTFTNPIVKITSPESGSIVSGIFSVAVNITWPPDTTGSVAFSIDGVPQAGSDSSEPYTGTFDANGLSQGTHTITAIATGSNGGSGTDSITVTAGADSAYPGEASDVSVTPFGIGRARVTWTNPADSDLTSVSFFTSTTSGVKGSLNSTTSASPGGTQSTILSGLVSGTPNYITIVPTDKTGNSNPTTKQYSVTPQ